jgi:hypothetical protein
MYWILIPCIPKIVFLQVGLRVHYRHFADDSPEFYASKIRHIENTSIDNEGSGLEDLVSLSDLTFLITF